MNLVCTADCIMQSHMSQGSHEHVVPNDIAILPAGTSVKRIYWAIIENVPGSAPVLDSGMINMPVGPLASEEAAKDRPKPASTHFQVLARHPLATWLRLQPNTGAATFNIYPVLRVYAPVFSIKHCTSRFHSK